MKVNHELAASDGFARSALKSTKAMAHVHERAWALPVACEGVWPVPRMRWRTAHVLVPPDIGLGRAKVLGRIFLDEMLGTPPS